ncbi:hypothetical protein DLM45_10890 [Hyphomicrobium methylovorum]|nr:hypothetical protein [Hyphomicrobium methylovorum]
MDFNSVLIKSLSVEIKVGRVLKGSTSDATTMMASALLFMPFAMLAVCIAAFAVVWLRASA